MSNPNSSCCSRLVEAIEAQTEVLERIAEALERIAEKIGNSWAEA